MELYSDLTLKELKERLRTAGLPVSGRKRELIARLTSVAGDDPPHDYKTPDEHDPPKNPWREEYPRVMDRARKRNKPEMVDAAAVKEARSSSQKIPNLQSHPPRQQQKISHHSDGALPIEAQHALQPQGMSSKFTLILSQPWSNPATMAEMVVKSLDVNIISSGVAQAALAVRQFRPHKAMAILSNVAKVQLLEREIAKAGLIIRGMSADIQLDWSLDPPARDVILVNVDPFDDGHGIPANLTEHNGVHLHFQQCMDETDTQDSVQNETSSSTGALDSVQTAELRRSLGVTRSEPASGSVPASEGGSAHTIMTAERDTLSSANCDAFVHATARFTLEHGEHKYRPQIQFKACYREPTHDMDAVMKLSDVSTTSVLDAGTASYKSVQLNVILGARGLIVDRITRVPDQVKRWFSLRSLESYAPSAAQMGVAFKSDDGTGIPTLSVNANADYKSRDAPAPKDTSEQCESLIDVRNEGGADDYVPPFRENGIHLSLNGQSANQFCTSTDRIDWWHNGNASPFCRCVHSVNLKVPTQPFPNVNSGSSYVIFSVLQKFKKESLWTPFIRTPGDTILLVAELVVYLNDSGIVAGTSKGNVHNSHSFRIDL